MAETTGVNSTLNTSGSTRTSNPKGQLKVEDFIKMMVTQLQNQDPMEPTKNEQLLTQMSQIGQLQSQQDLSTNQKILTDSIKTMVLQNNIGAASNLIGKDVEGPIETDEAGHTSQVAGKVEGVSIKDGSVLLKLDTGATLALDKVTSVDESITSSSDLAKAIRDSAGAKTDSPADGTGVAA
jgi:flagellar basal-body rod modification protein FlgD